MNELHREDHLLLARKSQALEIRAKLIQSIRLYFINNGFLEVETPLRIPSPAPEEHIEAIPSDDWFLQTSPELCMKRLLAAGYSRIFQISRCFRRDERGDKHLPEFTMLEWYVAGFDYQKLMDQCEDLISFTAENLGIKTIERLDRKIELLSHSEKMTVAEAFAKYAQVSMQETLDRDIFDEILVDRVEPNLGTRRPAFIYDYPAKLASLAKLKDENPSVSERFELYIGGLEIANGFSELTDEAEQRRRFEEAQKSRAEKNWASYVMPEKFLKSLGNLPPCAGIALGIDRLVMLMTGANAIDEVVAFTPEDL